MNRPVAAITLTEAARILGVARSTIKQRVLAGQLVMYGDRRGHRRLSRGDIELLAAVTYDWRRHIGDPESYWVVGEDAAAVLGVSPARVRMLASKDRLPFVWHADGVRLYRRAQLEVLARP